MIKNGDRLSELSNEELHDLLVSKDITGIMFHTIWTEYQRMLNLPVIVADSDGIHHG